LAAHLQHRCCRQQRWELGSKVVAVLEESILVTQVEEVPVPASLSLVLGGQLGWHLGALEEVHRYGLSVTAAAATSVGFVQ
jgi:hypothetical protein